MSILICAYLVCTGCSRKDKNDHAICRLYILPRNMIFPFYYVEVTDSQTIRTTLGKGASTINFELMYEDNVRFYPYRDSIIADRTQYKKYEMDETGRKVWYIEKFRQKEQRISFNDYRSLKDEIEKVKEMEEINEFADTGSDDVAGCIILIDDRQYIMLYIGELNCKFSPLINKIMELSPIDINMKDVWYGVLPTTTPEAYHNE